MPFTLPLPVRIAAGVLATGLERLRHLPRDLPALPVTVAGHAVRTSMRVQQEFAALVGRGDELLAGITSRPTEHPAWARFDDEDGAASEDGGDGWQRDGAATPDSVTAAAPGAVTAAAPGAVTATAAPGSVTAAADRSSNGAVPTHATVRTRRTRPAGTPDPADRISPTSPAGPNGHADPVDPVDSDEPANPPDMPGYDGLRLSQVRARLRGLDADAVARLLDHERNGAARAGHLTLLDNRLTTLRSGAAEDHQA